MDNAKKKVDLWLYYILIGVITFIALVFLPFFGSEIGMAFNFPNTAAGWIVYIVQQGLMAVVNVLIFHSFICQSYINVKDNENYIKARDIFHGFDNKEYIPMTLQQFNKREYGTKAVWIAIGTLMGGFALTQAVLSYDYIRALAYLFTIIMGIVFGIFEMKKYETYLTYEYLLSALYYQKKMEEKALEEQRKLEEEEKLQAEMARHQEMAQDEHLQQTDDSTCYTGGAVVLESTDSDSNISDIC